MGIFIYISLIKLSECYWELLQWWFLSWILNSSNWCSCSGFFLLPHSFSKPASCIALCDTNSGAKIITEFPATCSWDAKNGIIKTYQKITRCIHWPTFAQPNEGEHNIAFSCLHEIGCSVLFYLFWLVVFLHMGQRHRRLPSNWNCIEYEMNWLNQLEVPQKY